MTTLGDTFADLIRRVRQRDAEAAAELVRRFEPEIRLHIRTWLRMRDPGLRRVFDTMDICQSVLANFFVRAAAGQFDLDDPARALGLLVVMARHKLSEQAKYHHAMRRDVRLDRAIAMAGEAAAPGDTPSQVLLGRELLQRFLDKLTDDERGLADLRTEGRSWQEIADRRGGTPEARRKQWARTVDRVAAELGLSEAGED